MGEALKIGIAGLGTVGTGVVKILRKHADLIAERAGRPVVVTAVSARDSNKDRGITVAEYKWYDKASELAHDDNVDVVVELIGGSEGIAKDLSLAAFEAGKHVVTANKALVAHHGLALAQKAEENGCCLMYEAAVAGGIPIIKEMREGFAGNVTEGVYGILNGTCNFILSEMRTSGRDFDAVLKEAQKNGYAEADPTFDIGGIDAAHKLCILSALAFGVQPDFENISVTGISHISANDIRFAQELGYRIKLLGTAQRLNGKIVQLVEPCLVPEQSTIGAVEGVYNAVVVEADAIDQSVSVGRGAGEGPTASAVVADIIDIARGYRQPVFGIPAASMKAADWADPGDMEAQYYLHLVVQDTPGVLADISAIMRDHHVSMEAVLQRGRDPENPVSVVITSHMVKRSDIQAACAKIAAMGTCISEPCLMRIETF